MVTYGQNDNKRRRIFRQMWSNTRIRKTNAGKLHGKCSINQPTLARSMRARYRACVESTPCFQLEQAHAPSCFRARNAALKQVVARSRKEIHQNSRHTKQKLAPQSKHSSRSSRNNKRRRKVPGACSQKTTLLTYLLL